MAREDTSITSRWFIDSDRPMADAELTREIRDVDMLPISRADEKQLAGGLAYRAVRIRGGRVLPVDPPESYADDDLTDAFDVEDPFETSSVVLPTNGAGRLHESVARLVERGFEIWERIRLRTHGWTSPLRESLAADTSRAPTVRFAAIFSASLMVLGMFGFVSVASFALGSTVVQAEQSSRVPSKTAFAQRRALQKLATRWATAQSPDMAFSVEESEDALVAEPEPELSVAERRRIARAERVERRQQRARRRARARDD